MESQLLRPLLREAHLHSAGCLQRWYGDLDALYEMALDRLFESVEKRSLQYLAEAESLLRKAAEKGHVQAANFLQHVWPEESKSRRQKILRKPSE